MIVTIRRGLVLKSNKFPLLANSHTNNTVRDNNIAPNKAQSYKLVEGGKLGCVIILNVSSAPSIFLPCMYVGWSKQSEEFYGASQVSDILYFFKKFGQIYKNQDSTVNMLRVSYTPKHDRIFACGMLNIWETYISEGVNWNHRWWKSVRTLMVLEGTLLIAADATRLFFKFLQN